MSVSPDSTPCTEPCNVSSVGPTSPAPLAPCTNVVSSVSMLTQPAARHSCNPPQVPIMFLRSCPPQLMTSGHWLSNVPCKAHVLKTKAFLLSFSVCSLLYPNSIRTCRTPRGCLLMMTSPPDNPDSVCLHIASTTSTVHPPGRLRSYTANKQA